MPITYSAPKKGLKKLPKYVLRKADSTQCPLFELLGKDRIKEIRPVKKAKKKALEVKEKPKEMSFDSNAMFDRLVSEGPVNNFNMSSSFCGSFSHSSYDTSYEKENEFEGDKAETPEPRARNYLRGVKRGYNRKRNRICGSFNHDSINKSSSNSIVVEKGETKTTKMKPMSDKSIEQLILEPYVGSKLSNATGVIKPYSKTPRKTISSYLSPILPVLPHGSTSTPCVKQTSSFVHPSCSSGRSQDQNESLNDSVFCFDEKHLSTDLFASSSDEKMGRNSNDAAISTDLPHLRDKNCKDSELIPDNLLLSDISGIESAAETSLNLQTSHAVRFKTCSQDSNERESVCDLDKFGTDCMNSSEVMSMRKEDLSYQEIPDEAITSTLRNLRISMPIGVDGCSAQTNSSFSAACIPEVVNVSGSAPLKHKLKDHYSIEGSELSLHKSDLTHVTSMKDVNDQLCTHGLQECKVLLYRCDDVVPACSKNADIESDSHPANHGPVGSVDLKDLNRSPATLSNFAKPRKSSLNKNFSQEAVVLKPGKHWRRSISILAKVRSSLGEISVDGRKSLSCDDSKVRGKRYESTVSSIVEMQSTIDFIPEEEEVCNTSSIERFARQDATEELVVCASDVEEGLECWADQVYRLCVQDGPLPFQNCYPESLKEFCKKIGEGVYGEVFFRSSSPKHQASVIKVIPIEGSLLVNGEPQKTFKEIISEVRVAQELSKLRSGSKNVAATFNEVQAIRCVKGSYPSWLLELWNDFNDVKGSENESPEIFQDDQLFLVLELSHGGQDLEGFLFSSATQGLAAFKQIAVTLAVGESALNFEHRDLHWGNVLISETTDKKVNFILDGKCISIPSGGIQVSIIDFTLSRITDPSSGRPIFYDLSKDETLFTAYGDYQFEIYRIMKDFCGNKWDSFSPKTNIAWLHYLLDKLCTMARYRQRSGKAHNSALQKLSRMRDGIMEFSDAVSFVHAAL